MSASASSTPPAPGTLNSRRGTAASNESASKLLNRLLAEQSQLTAVDRFVRDHAAHQPGPAQARFYRALIPLETPRPGEQFAFDVDLDACSGCKACVSACHSLNGLDDHEVWRSTGLLLGGSLTEPYQQVVTSACHHCLDPACLNGCPVLAYEKDPVTGIVRHLDDQCIGCQYCVLKCPYDVPKYSVRRGIVRKCDMCQSRLAAHEAPACVQACPSQAIRIRIVSQAETAEQCDIAGVRLLPGTADSDYTQPTTRYLTRRGMPENVAPADAKLVQKQPAHWPLIWMLLGTQWAVGTLLAGWLMLFWWPDVFLRFGKLLNDCSGLALVLGLASSVVHLGRPLAAWRCFLGWRRSWMSREVLAFGLFAAATLGLVLATSLSSRPWVVQAAAASATGSGLLSVFCSGMIYVDTRRTFWSAGHTFPKFFGTVLQAGAATLTLILSLPARELALRPHLLTAGLIAVLSRSIYILWDGWVFATALEQCSHPIHGSVRLLWTQAKGLLVLRGILFALAGLMTIAGLVSSGLAAPLALALALLATFASHLVERYCFFTAVVAPRIPGGVVA